MDSLDASEVARANRNYLRGLYAVITDRDAHVRSCLLTGVSKHSKASLFRGLNNLLSACLGLPPNGIPDLRIAATWVTALQTTYGSVD